MRNIERIDSFLDELGKIWKEKYPDYRFGQLMFNFISTFGDPFFLEEEEFLIALQAYVGNENPKEALRRYWKGKDDV